MLRAERFLAVTALVGKHVLLTAIAAFWHYRSCSRSNAWYKNFDCIWHGTRVHDGLKSTVARKWSKSMTPYPVFADTSMMVHFPIPGFLNFLSSSKAA